MSYAEAKQIALLRLELRTCWELADRARGAAILARLSAHTDDDAELAAEVRRWSARFGAL